MHIKKRWYNLEIKLSWNPSHVIVTTQTEIKAIGQLFNYTNVTTTLAMLSSIQVAIKFDQPLMNNISNVGRFGQGDAETVLSLYNNYLRSLIEGWWREKSAWSNIVHGCWCGVPRRSVVGKLHLAIWLLFRRRISQVARKFRQRRR